MVIDERELQLHQAFHRICNSKTRFGHDLARLLRHFRLSLDFAKLVRMFAKFPEDVVSLLCGSSRDIISAHGHDAGDYRDNLSKVLV